MPVAHSSEMAKQDELDLNRGSQSSQDKFDISQVVEKKPAASVEQNKAKPASSQDELPASQVLNTVMNDLANSSDPSTA